MDLPLGLILAGGRGSRMGGADKALLTLGGETLLARVRSRLAGQVAGIAISANGDPARFAHLRLPVLADPVPGQPGPLAGILAGLDWAASRGARALVSAACDTPFLPLDLVARLEDAGGGALAMAATGAGRHPTFGLWPVALAGALRHALDGGVRRVRDFADAHGAVTAMFPDASPDLFFNVNTPQDMTLAGDLT